MIVAIDADRQLVFHRMGIPARRIAVGQECPTYDDPEARLFQKAGLLPWNLIVVRRLSRAACATHFAACPSGRDTRGG